MVKDCELRRNPGMNDDRKDVIMRLRALPDAFNMTDAELCRRIGVKPTAWANYVAIGSKRKFPVHIAARLCDEFNVTLDWIYRGKTMLIPAELVEKMRQVA